MTGSPLTGHPIALARWGPLREDERIQDLRHCEESDQAIQFFGVPDCFAELVIAPDDLRRRGDRRAIERKSVAAGGDLHRLAILDLAGEDELGERILHRFLDHAF